MERKRAELVLGCIGDDFTGSSDAASFLVNAGVRTILLNGIPKNMPDLDCEAVVIALKTRSIAKTQAVRDSLEALQWLEARGAEHLYIKYCSTFDSTREGNIGPVVDAALERHHEQFTILCPALPVNKRTVQGGRLFVDGVPLAESPMKNHPLNPMWASDIAELMKPQGKYDSLNITHEMLEANSDAEITQLIERFSKGREHFYVVPDYMNETHAKRIASLFGKLRILTGGSGILSYLPEAFRKELAEKSAPIPSSHTTGPGVIIAGSCSKATLEQINEFQNRGGLSLKIEPAKLLSGEQSVEDIWDFVVEHMNEDILVYSSDQAEKVKENQKDGRERVAGLLERTMAEIGKRAVNHGFKRLIVAGGETSGAVTLALGFDAFIIGESVAPGVPIMVPVQQQNMRLILKSGNFGQKDFFQRALDQTKGE